MSDKYFKFYSYFFSTGTLTTKKLDEGIPVTDFSGLQVPVFLDITIL